MSSEPLLEVHGLAVSFATEEGVVHAVDDVGPASRPRRGAGRGR